MDSHPSTTLPGNGAPDVPLLKLKTTIVGSSTDCQPTGIRDAYECLLVRSTQYAEMYKAPLISDGDGKSVEWITVKTFRVLPKGKNNGEMAMIEFLRNQSILATKQYFLAPVVEGSIRVGGIVSTAAIAQFYSNGNVRDHISRNPDVQRMVLAKQMAVGLAHVHSKGIIHGNFCPENVCITDDGGEVRITDIGMAVLLRDIVESGRVPKRWMYKPSEELRDGICNTKTDVYSFASTVYSMYAGSTMFTSGSACMNLLEIVERGHIGIFGACNLPVGMGEGLWEIVKMCWAQDASKRPSMVDVVNSL